MQSLAARMFLVPWICAAALVVSPAASAQDHVRFLKEIPGHCDESEAQKADGTDAALNVEHGTLAVSRFEPGWHSAQWVLHPMGEGASAYQIANLWTGDLLVAYQKEKDRFVVETMNADAQIPDWSQRGETGSPTRLNRPLRTQETVWTIQKGSDGKVDVYQEPVAEERKARLHLSIDGCAIAVNGEPGEWTMEKSGEDAPPPSEFPTVWLHLQNANVAVNVESGQPQASAIEEGWLSAQWEMRSFAAMAESLPNGKGEPIALINKWTGKALGLDATSNSLVMTDPPAFDQQGKLSSPQSIWRAWGPPGGPVSLKNGTQYLGYGGKVLGVGTEEEAVWMLDNNNPASQPVAPPPPVEPYTRIESSDGQVLNIEGGPPAAGKAEPGWWSAMWVEERMSDGSKGRFAAYRNRWTNQYLAVVGGQLTLVDPVPKGKQIRQLQDLSYSWRLQGARSGNNIQWSIQNMQSGLYLDMQSNVLTLTAPAKDVTPPSIWSLNPVQ